MEKRIILVIRRDKDYWLYGKESHYHMNNNDVKKLRDMWDSYFNLKFIDFRLQLEAIASSNYLDNKFDEIHLYSAIEPRKIKDELYDKLELYNSDIIVPVDDDDWIDPSLAGILRNIETDKKFFVWDYYKSWREERFAEYQTPKGTWATITCAWGVRGWNSFLERHNHLKLSEEEYSQTYSIKKPLSLKVDNLSSLGFLYKIVSKRKGREDTWINSIVKKLEADLKITGENHPKSFQEQFKSYIKLLKKLL